MPAVRVTVSPMNSERSSCIPSRLRPGMAGPSRKLAFIGPSTSGSIVRRSPSKSPARAIGRRTGSSARSTEADSFRRWTELLGANRCFARPNLSRESGLEEQTKGLERERFPKATDFRSVSDAEAGECARHPRDGRGFRVGLRGRLFRFLSAGRDGNFRNPQLSPRMA